MSFFTELKRRNVFRVAAAYIIVGWLLTEVLATLLPMFGAPDWVGKAVVVVAAVTFVPVVIFAWAFELTPDGIKREKDVDRSQSITDQTGRKLNYVTIAAVILGVAFMAWSNSGVEKSSTSADDGNTAVPPSVAVLPFVNMSGNTDNEYFSDGLTETLLHMLSQVPDIKVAARTSSFAFKNKEQDIRKIAGELGVAHVLEGSVQRAGDKVRITAQLIRADDGFHVWSSNYDRTLDDIFAIQDEIAADVGHSLKSSLLGSNAVQIESIGTHDVLAYDLYLQALSHRAAGSYASLEEAEELLKQALLRDPEFHDAKRVLGSIYYAQQETGLKDQDQAFENAVILLEQVYAARPGDATAKALLTSINAFRAENTGSYRALKDAVPKMLQLVSAAPNDIDVRIECTRVLLIAGQTDEALLQIEAAQQIDPINARVHYHHGRVLERLDRYEEARGAFARSLELQPDQPNAYSRLAEMSLSVGDGVGYVSNLLNAMAIDSQDHEIATALAWFLYRLGLPDHADYYRDRAQLIAPDSPSARLAMLVSARARGDWRRSDKLARSMVMDNIDERHGSYFMAVYTVLMNGVRNEGAAEALDFIERYQPGFNNPVSNEISPKVRYAQTEAGSAWSAAFGEEKAGGMLRQVWDILETLGVNPHENEVAYLDLLALTADTGVAVDFALEHVMTNKVTDAIFWREIFEYPHMHEVSADPRVQEGLRRWDERAVATREEVRMYLDGLQ